MRPGSVLWLVPQEYDQLSQRFQKILDILTVVWGLRDLRDSSSMSTPGLGLEGRTGEGLYPQVSTQQQRSIKPNI